MRRTNTQKVARELRKVQWKYECEWEKQINSSKPNAERLQALHERLLDVELNFRCVQEICDSNPEKRVEAAARRGISVYDPDSDDLNPSPEPSGFATSATGDVNIDASLSAQASPALAPREPALAADGVGAPDSCPPPPPSSPEPSAVDAVLRLAERGWRLFPVRQRDKTPLVKDWPSVATTDADTIRAWAQQYPGCNWGLACGPASGVWVLDVDGKEGTESFLALQKEHGREWTNTLAVKTARGGHLDFLWPKGLPEGASIKNSAGKLAPGLDVRGDGGYVLVPPSVHPSGVTYQWGRGGKDVPIASAPSWLLDLVFAPAPQTVAPSAGSSAQVIGEGQRNATLTSLAGTMRKRNMTPEAIEVALLAENANRCRPPLPEAEVRSIVQSISRYAPPPTPVPVVRRPDLLTLADVESKEVEWLWRPYLPAGMLAMLSGDPAAGKTFLALAMAAALTTGRVPYPCEPCAPVDVLYMSVENDPACVIRPRFDSLGGDVERLHLLRGTVVGEGEETKQDGVWLSDTSTLQDALDRTHARLLIVDPIQSYLGAEVDAHRSNETRPVLDGLVRLADEHQCCVLLLRHLSKAPSGRAIHRGLGSIDLTGAVRSEMLAGNPPNDPQQRAMVQIKNNLGAYGPALGYEIDATGQFFWTGESTLTQSDLLAPEGVGQDSAKDEAVEWLQTFLADGPRTARQLERAAREAGHTWATIRRAKQKAGAESRKVGLGEGWVWQLADQDAHEDAQDAQHTEMSIFGEDEHLDAKHVEDVEDAQNIVMSTLGDGEHLGVKPAEDAQICVLSTLGEDEHLGTPDREKGEL